MTHTKFNNPTVTDTKDSHAEERPNKELTDMIIIMIDK
jgi:hypothetical protein